MPNSTMTLLIGLTLLVVLAVIFWPEQGLLSRLRRFRRLNTRVLTEHALNEIFNLELRGERPTLQGIAGALQIHPNKAAELLDGYPAIGGQLATYAAAQLRAYRGGQRTSDPNQMMRNTTARMTDAEIDAVASYVQGLR